MSEFETNGSTMVAISKEQIDTALERAQSFARSWESGTRGEARGIRWVLDHWGIVVCEECGGSGHWEQEPQTGGCYPDQAPECTSCQGHGWVIKGVSDE